MIPITTQQRFVQEAKVAMQHFQVKKIYWTCRRFYTLAGDLVLKGKWSTDSNPSDYGGIDMICSEDLKIDEILDMDCIDRSIISACEAAGLSAAFAGIWLLEIEQT